MTRVAAKKIRQMVLSTGVGVDPSQTPERVELYNANGTPINPAALGGSGSSGSGAGFGGVYDDESEYDQNTLVFHDRALWALMQGDAPAGYSPGDAQPGLYLMNSGPGYSYLVEEGTELPATVNLVEDKQTIVVTLSGNVSPLPDSTIVALDVEQAGGITVTGLGAGDYALICDANGVVEQYDVDGTVAIALGVGVHFLVVYPAASNATTMTITAANGLATQNVAVPVDEAPLWLKVADLNPKVNGFDDIQELLFTGNVTAITRDGGVVTIDSRVKPADIGKIVGIVYEGTDAIVRLFDVNTGEHEDLVTETDGGIESVAFGRISYAGEWQILYVHRPTGEPTSVRSVKLDGTSDTEILAAPTDGSDGFYNIAPDSMGLAVAGRHSDDEYHQSIKGFAPSGGGLIDYVDYDSVHPYLDLSPNAFLPIEAGGPPVFVYMRATNGTDWQPFLWASGHSYPIEFPDEITAPDFDWVAIHDENTIWIGVTPGSDLASGVYKLPFSWSAAASGASADQVFTAPISLVSEQGSSISGLIDPSGYFMPPVANTQGDIQFNPASGPSVVLVDVDLFVNKPHWRLV